MASNQVQPQPTQAQVGVAPNANNNNSNINNNNNNINNTGNNINNSVQQQQQHNGAGSGGGHQQQQSHLHHLQQQQPPQQTHQPHHSHHHPQQQQQHGQHPRQHGHNHSNNHHHNHAQQQQHQHHHHHQHQIHNSHHSHHNQMQQQTQHHNHHRQQQQHHGHHNHQQRPQQPQQQQHQQQQHQQQQQQLAHQPHQTQLPPQMVHQHPQQQPPNPALVPHGHGISPIDVMDSQQQGQAHEPQVPAGQQATQLPGAPPIIHAQPQHQQHPQQHQHPHPHPQQQQRMQPPNPHNPMVKHHATNAQQQPTAGNPLHQQAHHLHNHHQHHQQMAQHPQSMQMSPAQGQPHQWPGGPPHHPSQGQQSQHLHQHPHHPPQVMQQHHPQPQPQGPGPQQQQPPQHPQMPPQPGQQQAPHPHMLPTQPIMIQHYPNIMYPQMGHPNHFVAPGLPQYEPPTPASHPGDTVNLNSHVQTPTSINNHHPANMQPSSQMQAGVNPATSGANNVHPVNNGPMVDATHLHGRHPPPPPHMAQPYFPSPYMQPGPHNMMLDPYGQMNLAPYPGAPPAHNFGMMPGPIRVTGDMAPRAPFDPQNPTATLPAPKPPIALVPGVKMGAPLPVPLPVTAMPTPTPPRPSQPRKSRAIPIINPDTGHALTLDELKGTPATTAKNRASLEDSAESRISSTQETPLSDKQSSLSANGSEASVVRTPDDPISSEKLSTTDSKSVNGSITSNSTVDVSKVSPVSEKSQSTASTARVENASPEHDIMKQDEIDAGTYNPQGDDKVAELNEKLASAKISDESPEQEPEKLLNEPQESSEDLTEDTPKIPKKPELPNLPYQAGQFSPLNRNGIRKYTIEFCRAVEKELKLDINNGTNMNSNHRVDFSPYFRNDVPAHHVLPNRRPSQQVPQKPRKIIPATSLQQDVDLKTVENPWKPELEAEKSQDSTEMDTKRLLKVFRGHLNKLTPQKYDSLIEKIADLDLAGSERLNSVIDLVFDKAVDEPGFCELYAKMCKVIAVKDQDFCFHLVKKCQEEFETSDLYDGLNVDDRKAEIETEADSAKRKIMYEELYEDMRQRRKKYLGTIKLIGEMYKFGLLLPKIIGLCMQHLIGGASNENIECLCSLIATVGSKMANEPDENIKLSLKHTLTVLSDLANPKKSDLDILESRIKFKIMDTIDLSRRNWRPRMVENNPKKIEELREETERAAKEEAKQAHHYNHSNSSKNSNKFNSGKADHRRDVNSVLNQQRTKW